MMPGMGRGGMNPRQMEQMMKKMGISTEDIDATEVIIRTRDKEYHILRPQVTIMAVKGEKTYQITGQTKILTLEEAAKETTHTGPSIPQEDISLVANTAGVSEDEARRALEECKGDLAEAIVKLQEAKGL